MTDCTPDPDVLAFTGDVAQTWSQHFELTAGDLGTVTADTLVIQIRQGQSGTSDDTLIASFPEVDNAILIDVTDMDLSGDPPVFAWSIDAADTAGIAHGETYWIEARATINGIEGAYLMESRRWYVGPAMAVAE